jgi:CspA family cold shock protein
MQQGTVAKKLDKGFGFIKVDGAADGSKDLFFHSNELKNISFDELMEGDKVSFEVGDSPKGPNAINVSKI